MTIKQEYRELCSIVANNLDSPGKGGNASVKDELMIIKSSGENLKDKNHIFSLVHNDSFNVKPSMEYKMHQNIGYKFVLHYHPVYVLPYLCSNYEFKFGTTLDYYSPGDELAEAIKNCNDNIIFLRNHGVVIAANTLSEIKQHYNHIKTVFYKAENSIFTPDDLVDSESEELWLFRQYIKYVCFAKGLTLNTLSEDNINTLNNDDNEKYRKEKM